MANSALEITNQHPGHPDHGMAKAANIVSWIGIGLAILGLIVMILYFVLIGFIIAADAGV